MYKLTTIIALLACVFFMSVSAAAAVELKASDIANAKGDGPDGKGNTEDDTWGFWFELAHSNGVFHRLDIATATMPAQQKQSGIPGKVTGPVGGWLPNPKETEGWIFHSDWDGRCEGVWGDKKADQILLHPYVEKNAHCALAVTYRVPADGTYKVSAKITDLAVAGAGGRNNGVTWQIQVADGGKKAEAVEKGGPVGDKVGPASAEFSADKVSAKKGELIRLVIDPNGWWGGDMTRIDYLRIEPVGAGEAEAEELPPGTVQVKVSDVTGPKGDGPDGKGNTADDTWGFWFELAHSKGVFGRLRTHTATMPAGQKEKGIPGRVRGPIGGWLPNPKETEGWIYHRDWDGRFEGVWGDTKANQIIMYPYVEKNAHCAVALTYKVPKTGSYTISGKVTDIQVAPQFKKHDGIVWRVEKAVEGKKGEVLGKGGPIGDGHDRPDSGKFTIKDAAFQEGELIRLVIHPRGWWGSDMTRIDYFGIAPAGEVAPETSETVAPKAGSP